MTRPAHAAEDAAEAPLDDPSLAGVLFGHVVDRQIVLDPGLRRQAVRLEPRPVHDVPDGWRAAIQESLERAERLRLEAPPLDYEGLVGALADLLAPLDVLDA